MNIRKEKKNPLQYKCPFCDADIKASRKTEILYRNQWINGCYDCFALSIDTVTVISFQKKDYYLS